MLEATVDRLWLVADGTVKPFEGDIEDYRKFVLAGPEPAPERKAEAKAAPEARERPLRERARWQKEIAAAETRIAKLQDLVRRIDETLAAESVNGAPSNAAIGLSVKRSELLQAIESAEEQWLELSTREQV